MKLAIYGTGGSGREVQEIANEINENERRWDEIVFIDDFTEERSLYGSRILSFERAKEEFDRDGVQFLVAVGEPASREFLYSRVTEAEYELATIIHPAAFVAASASIGKGVFVKMQSIVSSGAVLEDNVFIQADVIVGHDVRVGRHSQISAFSHIAGHAELGQRTYLGVRSSVREECVMGDDVVVAMGGVVMEKKVPGNVFAIGNPAKYVRRKAGSKVFS